MEGLNALALTGATVYASPDGEPLHDAAILLRDGKIAAVGSRRDVALPDDAQIIDCRGYSIVAGFWNSHVHFHERKWADAQAIPAPELEQQLRDLTCYGVTSCFDLSSPLQNTCRLRDRIESREVCGPRILTTGEGLIPPGGSPSADVFRALGLVPTALREVNDASQARDTVRKLVEAGADAIKLFVSSPSAGALMPDLLRAAANEAHNAGKLVFAHPNTATDVLAAAESGIDVIAHTTPRSGAWDADLLASMSSRHVALIPTLMLWNDLMRHDRLTTRKQLVSSAVGQLRAWRQLDGSVIFGTDLGAVKYDPVDEYELMAEAGMTFRQILASLTTVPARWFGDARNRGEIRAGYEADLAVLGADPAADLQNLSSVRLTIRAGRVIYRAP